VAIPDPPDFRATLQAAQAGDRRALGLLWATFHPRVVRYLEARDPDNAEDVASDVWMAVADHLAEFRGDRSDFAAWVFTIARNKSVDGRRRRRRRPVEVGEVPEELVLDDDPAGAVVELADTDAVMELVRRLPPDQADVVLLRVVAGLDMDRVATMLGKSSGSIRVLQHRGLKRLAALVGERPPDRSAS
jgi:RNA polymerase sigma-70 factor (ECF subfamily)